MSQKSVLVLSRLSMVCACWLAEQVFSPSAAADRSINIHIRLMSVDVLQTSDLPQQEIFWDSGVVKGPLVRVSFSTSADLQSIAVRDHYNIDNVVSPCLGSVLDPTKKIDGFPFVFDSVGRINEFRNPVASQSVRAHGNELHYHVYFEVAQSGIHGFYSYNLATHPADLCLDIRGVEEQEFGPLGKLSANTLIITREALSAAIAHGKKY